MDVPTCKHQRGIDRRTLLGGMGAAAVAGTAATVGLVSPAGAQRSGFWATSAPKPIPQVIDAADPAFPPPPDPFRFIHWLLPGPDGVSTPFLGLPFFGLDADYSTITDFDGFVAYAVLGGSAHDGDGNSYDTELDVRVMHGRYVGEDGQTHHGTFGFF